MQTQPFGTELKRILNVNLGCVFSNCAELPLYNFIKILTTEDLRYMVKRGFPSAKQKSDAWENIFTEYNTISGNRQSAYLLNLLREYYSIPHRLAIIQTLVDNLAKRYDPELVKCLRSLGFRHKYLNGQGMARDLQITVTQSKGLLIKYRTVYDDLEKLQSDSKKAEPNDYDLILAQLSKWQGFRIDPHQTTVSGFVAIVKLFKEDNKPKK